MSRTPQAAFDAIAAQRAARKAELMAKIATTQQHTVTGLLHAMSGHDDNCDCHICVELAVDEACERSVWRGRW